MQFKLYFMNIGFADSFWKSLEKLNTHNTWWYKLLYFFRRGLPNFFKNLWYFRKELWNFRGWDYSFNLELFAKSLEKTAEYLEVYGIEIDSSRIKKVQKIKRVVELLKRVKESSYLESAEQELGEIIMRDWEFEETGETTDNPLGEIGEKLYSLVDHETEEEKEHNKKVYDRAIEIENEEWKEIWKILEGQDLNEYRKLYDAQTEEQKRKQELWDDWYDGSGMKHWWD